MKPMIAIAALGLALSGCATTEPKVVQPEAGLTLSQLSEGCPSGLTNLGPIGAEGHIAWLCPETVDTIALLDRSTVISTMPFETLARDYAVRGCINDLKPSPLDGESDEAMSARVWSSPAWLNCVAATEAKYLAAREDYKAIVRENERARQQASNARSRAMLGAWMGQMSNSYSNSSTSVPVVPSGPSGAYQGYKGYGAPSTTCTPNSDGTMTCR